jgi:hypothetical protein
MEKSSLANCIPHKMLTPLLISRSHQKASDKFYHSSWQSQNHESYDSTKSRRSCSKAIQDRHTHKPIGRIPWKTITSKDGVGHGSSSSTTYRWLVIVGHLHHLLCVTLKQPTYWHRSHCQWTWHWSLDIYIYKKLSVRLHPQNIRLQHSLKYKHSCHSFSVTAYYGVCLAGLKESHRT